MTTSLTSFSSTTTSFDSEDRQLIAAAKTGCRDSLGSLLEMQQSEMLGIAYCMMSVRLQKRMSPEDAVQQTCMEIVRDFAMFEGETVETFKAWAQCILRNRIRNAVYDNVTSPKRSINQEVSTSSQNGGEEGDWIGNLPGRCTTAHEQAERCEAVEAMLEVLATIPERQAEAVRLRYLEGLSYAEIAVRMELPEMAAAAMLKRGIQSLRDKMGVEK